MAHITVLGGTGYAGRHLVAAAASRGHSVTSYSRSQPSSPVAGVDYRTGDLTDPAVLAAATQGADVVVSALSPRGELEGPGVLRALEQTIADAAATAGVRFGVIGGAGSLLVAPDGPRVADTPDFPAEIKPEAQEMAGVLDDLRASDSGVDWFYVSPAGGFGPWAEGEATGTYRIGGDVLLVDDAGQSNISGADFADAVVREIETPAHRGSRFTVAY
ncbi:MULTISPECIES: NAD(P)-dependent oxidoreductase [unclassified Gordonia (in: high G+C Gram-positive bacteria)]|uniref:NAD(P)-dependent oxidoreductase n=1 Tax=unclassified Gordonia (in: high G+C Gram-positive bacteria) TaxID=2657482 RepID=UPI001FFFD415|nr:MULTISPECIES: NAD(P)H-binding protein [unclassified Gordonia (in: high G+C Gram-positive bacteria)]UQE73368.1 NAD(P)H-binding protein [Gordonia sp. PP30]